MSHLLERSSAVLLVIDVQERINGVMTSQDHMSRLEVLIEAFQALERPILLTEQYPKGLGPTVPELAGLLDEGIAEDGRRAKNHLLEANLRLVVSLDTRVATR